MPIVINTVEEALKRVRDLQAKESERIIIGVVGKPGAENQPSHLIY